MRASLVSKPGSRNKDIWSKNLALNIGHCIAFVTQILR